MWSAFALAFGLAMDATAVAAARGMARRPGELVVLPLLFGVFQAGMAALGWVTGRWGGGFLEAWDHWIAFALLVGIGGKMLVEAWRGAPGATDRTGIVVYLGLAIATSIDAAAAGLTLPLLAVEPWFAIAAIGAVTAACSALGYVAGRAASGLGKPLEIAGGLVLIAIGVRLLVQHL